MHDFNKPLECSKCESEDRYQVFYDLKGNGIKCLDCLHKKYVHKPKKGATIGQKRKAMAAAWDKMKNARKF